MQNINITFIGGGNMARALVAGLIQTGFDPKNITITNPTLTKLESAHEKFGVNITQDNQMGMKTADVIVLAVKPQKLKTVCLELADIIADKAPLVISIAAGITVDLIESWLSPQAAIVWAMPNTPVAVQAGATGLFANHQVSNEQREIAESIFHPVGLAVWVVQESHMNIITAISGGGPAYLFLIIESIQQAAVALGLPEETAKLLTAQMAVGASRMVLESELDVQDLRAAVTSPQGITAAALQVFEDGNIRELFQRAMNAACQRGNELADQYR